MNEEFDTDKLFRVLLGLDIPVLDDLGNARSAPDIISDLFTSWFRCDQPNQRRTVCNALNWIAESGEPFTERQNETLRQINLFEEHEQICEESDKALDEFLDSFRIVGGDSK